MRDVTSIFPDLKGYDTDERTRRYLVPKRVMWKCGDVSGEENILKPVSPQITLDQHDCLTLTNGSDGENAAILLDFGREIAGSIRILTWFVRQHGEFNAYDQSMAQFRIRFGESVSEAMAEFGEKNTTNNHAPRDFTMRVPHYSSVETNESGFRFARIDLLTKNTSVTIKAIQGVFMFRNVEYKGNFRCNDELVNRIYDTAAYTVHLNMQEYLWDGIKRDRLVWIGDMQTEVMAIEELFGFNTVVPKSLDLIRDETPVGSWMNGIQSYSLWWIFEHYDWYMAFGNKEYLFEQKDYMIALLKVVCERVDDNGKIIFGEDERVFIDWPNNDNQPATKAAYQGMTIMTLEKGAELCEIFGDFETAKLCRETRERMFNYIPEAYGSKQAGSFLSVSGLCDAKKMADDLLLVGGAKGFSTFLGFYTLAAIAKAGKFTEAIDCMKEYWGAMLNMGATSFWEDFDMDWLDNAAPIDDFVPEGKKDIHGDYGKYCYIKFRHSLCHGWSGGPVPYLTQYVAGITMLEPGCKKLSVKPNLSGLEWFECDYPTPYGIVSVKAKKLPDGSEDIQINAPAEVEIVR